MAVVTIITVQVWTGKAVNHLSPCSTGICAHAGGSVLWAWFILLTRDSVIFTNAFTSGALLLPGFLAQAIFFSCKVRICALGLRCCNVRPYILSCQYLLQDLEIRAIIFLLLTLMTSGHFLNCLWSRTLNCLVSTCHGASKLCLLLSTLFFLFYWPLEIEDNLLWFPTALGRTRAYVSHRTCCSPFFVIFIRACSNVLMKYASSYTTVRSFQKVSSEWDNRSVGEVQAGGPQGWEPASKEAERSNMCS